jgi:hypothetical protein
VGDAHARHEAVVLVSGEIIGGASPKLTERGIVELEDFPLMRRLHAVAQDEPRKRK